VEIHDARVVNLALDRHFHQLARNIGVLERVHNVVYNDANLKSTWVI